MGLGQTGADPRAGAGPRAPPSRRRCSDEPSRAASGDPFHRPAPPIDADAHPAPLQSPESARASCGSPSRPASARNCEILRSWRVISIADMLPVPRINDMLHRVTFATAWESPRSQVLGRLVSLPSEKLHVSHPPRRRNRARQIAENITRFFAVLAEWSRAETHAPADIDAPAKP